MEAQSDSAYEDAHATAVAAMNIHAELAVIQADKEASEWRDKVISE